MVPVRAERGKHEADDGRCAWVVDFKLELRGVDAAFTNTVFGATVAHDCDAAAHVVALEFFVGEDAAVGAELVGVVRGEMFGAEVIVGFCEFGGVKASNISVID
jgi:hypothetical protein